jgi:hypothetical protein
MWPTSGRCWSSGGTVPNDQAAALGGFSLARIAAVRSDALYGRLTTSGLCSRYNWHVSSKSIREYLRLIGKRGGAAGTGSSKVRGDAEYYRRISRKAAKVRRAKRKVSKR